MHNWHKIVALLVLGYIIVNGWGNAARQAEGLLNLPKRMMTMHELKQLDRLIAYALVGNESRNAADLNTTMRAFCAQEVTGAGRNAAEDYWHKPYRMFCHGHLHDDDESFRLRPGERDKFVVVSAGGDKKFLTDDDLTSRQSTHAEVQRLQELIASHQRSAGRSRP